MHQRVAAHSGRSTTRHDQDDNITSNTVVQKVNDNARKMHISDSTDKFRHAASGKPKPNNRIKSIIVFLSTSSTRALVEAPVPVVSISNGAGWLVDLGVAAA